MKKMYLLQVRVTPAPGGIQQHLAGGHGGVWVWADSEDRVENEAEQYLLKHGWMIEERKSINEVPIEAAQQDPIHLANYLKAQENGAAAELHCFERYKP